MKKYIKIILSIVLVVCVLGIVFCIVDSLRVHADEEPIFCFSHKILDYEYYSAKVDCGLGYKIIRYTGNNQPDIIRIGTIFMTEKSPYIEDQESGDIIINSGDSGEQLVSGDSGDVKARMTTFGEKYKDSVGIEGIENEVYAQNINSKIGYSMTYYYELFEYKGYEDHDIYDWKAIPSGDSIASMKIVNISDEKLYNDTLEEISKEKNYEEISGDEIGSIQKAYHRTYKDNDIEKINDTYIIVLNDLKYRVDMNLPVEAQEGIGKYMKKMVNSIK